MMNDYADQQGIMVGKYSLVLFPDHILQIQLLFCISTIRETTVLGIVGSYSADQQISLDQISHPDRVFRCQAFRLFRP